MMHGHTYLKTSITGVFFKFLYELPDDDSLGAETCNTIACQSLHSGV
jgi:hypothetical protein